MKKINIFSILVLSLLFIPSVSLVLAQPGKGPENMPGDKPLLPPKNLVMNQGTLENRENIMERIRERIASSTASSSATSSEKRMEQFNNRFQRQLDQREMVRERLLNKELKVIEVLQKIADKIADRIAILADKGLDMEQAKDQLTQAVNEITDITNKADNLADLLETEITDTNKESLFQEIKAVQGVIRVLAKEAHGLLVDTVKEITKVLPRNGQGTSTATTTTN